MGGLAKTPLIQLSVVKGVNYDLPKRTADEAIDASNVVWGVNGMAPWLGDGYYERLYGRKPIQGMAFTRWGDLHDSLLVASDGKVYSKEAGKVFTLTYAGSTSLFSQDETKPVWFERSPTHDIVIFGQENGERVYKWDGNVDREVEEFECPFLPDGVKEFRGRLVAWGYPENKLLVYYSDLDDIEIKLTNIERFADCPGATRIMGMVSSGNFAIVVADKGAWACQYTGSYPFWLNQGLLSTSCSCVARGSIVDVGGVITWFGDDDIYAFDGQQLTGLNRSQDVRQADRIGQILRRIQSEWKYRIVACWHAPRRVAIFSYPDNDTWRSIVYDPATSAFWPLSFGWSSLAAVKRAGRDETIGGAPEGTVVVDFGKSSDSDDTPVSWSVTLGGKYDGISRFKFLRCAIDRPYGGEPVVTLEFWGDCSPDPISTVVNANYAYYRGALIHPNRDQEDSGVPPDAMVTCWADVNMIGTKLVVRVSNDSDFGPRNGPTIPISQIAITGSRLS